MKALNYSINISKNKIKSLPQYNLQAATDTSDLFLALAGGHWPTILKYISCWMSLDKEVDVFLLNSGMVPYGSLKI